MSYKPATHVTNADLERVERLISATKVINQKSKEMQWTHHQRNEICNMIEILLSEVDTILLKSIYPHGPDGLPF